MAIDTSIGSSNIPFDVILTASNGLELRLMLGRNRYSSIGSYNTPPSAPGFPMGPKMWALSEVPVPANIRVSTEGVGLTDLPPEMEAVFFREDHSGGMGTLQVALNKTDYYTGVAHTSIKGKVVKPPYVAEVSLSTAEATNHVFAEVTFSAVSYLYVSDGRYLHRSSDGSTFTQVLDLTAGRVITDLAAFGDSAGTVGLVVAFNNAGTTQPYKYTTNGTSFSDANSGANRQPDYLFIHDKTLYGLANPASMYTSVAPFAAAAAWAGPTVIGDLASDFHWGTTVADVVMLAKDDRIYTVDATGAVGTLVAQFANNPGAANFAEYTVAYNSNVYSMVDGEVWEYDPVTGALRPLGLLDFPDQEHAADAHAGLAYDGRALYAIHHTAFYNSGNTGGHAIARIEFDDKGAPVFERWMIGTETKYRPDGRLHFTRLFSALTTGRHLFISVDTAGKLGRMELPATTDPTLSTDSRYALEETMFRSGWITHNFPGQDKDYTEVTVDLGGLQPTHTTTTVKVYYYLDYDLSTRYTLDDNLVTTGLHTLSVPSAYATARAIMLEFSLNSTDNTATPILFSWTVRASVKFRAREVITLGARMVDRDEGRGGQKSPLTAVQLRSVLHEMRKTKNLAIKYRDYRGYTFANVRVLPKFDEVDAVDERTGEDITILTFRVMRMSAD